jgi:hypothetical protein
MADVDAWLQDAPPGLVTDLWAAALSVAFGAADRARTIQSRLSAADDATSQFFAARLVSLIALKEGKRIDVEPLGSAISSLPTQERWRAIGSLATLEAGAAAAHGGDPVAVLARYFTLLPPDPAWRTEGVRTAIAYVGLVVIAAFGLAFLFVPMGLPARGEPADDVATLSGAVGVIAAMAALVAVLVALVLRARRWAIAAIVLVPSAISLLWLADQWYRSAR